MPGIDEADLEQLFTYHASDDEQKQHYEAIRHAAKNFARVILHHTPKSPDQSVAIRAVREAVAWANASVALKGQF